MILIELIVSILGVSFGSFIGACAYRLPRGISIVSGRSFCPHCRSSLGWYETIPLAGFLVNRGRCQRCGVRIPTADFLVELGSGALFLVLFLQYGVSIEFVVAACFALLMVLIALIDWRHLIIPNKVIAIGLALGLVLRIIPWQWNDLLDALISAAAAGAALLCIMLIGNWVFRKQTMGMGDVKLSILIGFYIGLEGFLLSLWFAALAGALYGVVRIGLRHQTPDDRLPFGSFLAGSSVLYLLFQTQLHEWIGLWLISALS